MCIFYFPPKLYKSVKAPLIYSSANDTQFSEFHMEAFIPTFGLTMISLKKKKKKRPCKQLALQGSCFDFPYFPLPPPQYYLQMADNKNTWTCLVVLLPFFSAKLKPRHSITNLDLQCNCSIFHGFSPCLGHFKLQWPATHYPRQVTIQEASF